MKYLVPLATMFMVLNMQAQKQGNIWYFGDHAGLDFTTGTATEIAGGQTHYVGCPACHAEGSTVICDSSGTLLFYSDGAQVWNAQHQQMPNGDSLLSNTSATQSSLILPNPGSDHMFYLFTVDDFFINDLQHGFRYSVIDMCLDGALGDIVISEKNVLVTDSVTEKLVGVRHANGMDYWVIVHKWNSDAFHAYPLSASGLGAPTISNVGSSHPITGGIGGSIGQMKVSPDGTKLAIASGNATPSILEYFDFDPATGTVSNVRPLSPSPFWMYYGVAFSPNSTKLYATVSLNGNGLFQYDLDAGGGDPDSVLYSLTQIAGFYNYFGLQLAVDGKIYVARSPNTNNPNIGVIHQPDNVGASCDYEDAAIVLSTGLVSYGFPSFVDSYHYSNGVLGCETSTEGHSIDQIVRPPYLMNDMLRVELPGNGTVQMDLVDSSGRLVRSYPSTSERSSWYVGDLRPGMYLVRLFLNGHPFTSRFIKN